MSLSASIAADAAVSWRPLHFHGEIGVHGAAGLSVYGYGLSVSVDARLAADVFDPYHVLGQFHVGIGLPWPRPDFSVDVSMEWGPEPIFPSLPALVKEVTVEHFKVTSTWPLPVGGLLGPRVDRGNGYLLEPVPVPPLSAPPPATAPVVPLDARPRITFARPVHDDARAGVNGRETVPARERLGDPQADEGPVLVRYGLREVALDAWRGATWMPIARSVGPGQPPNPPGLPRLWGSWAPLPALPDLGGTAVAQVKLFLWSRTPFDHTTHTGGAWDEWITDHATDLPCLPIPEPVWTCHGLTGLTEGDLVEPPWTSPDVPGFTVAWNPPVMREVHPVDDGLPGASALCLPPRLTINALPVDCVMTVSVPAPSRAVRLGVVDPTGVTVTARHADGTVTGPYPGGTSADPWVTVPVADVVELTVTPGKLACVYQLCLEHGLSDEELADRQDLQTHVQGEVVRWSQDGHVLEPDTAYRLRIVSTVTATGEGELAGQERDHAMEQLAYFRTGGPPGLVTLSTPEGYPGAETFRSGLDDLTRYVRQTVPPTVPAAGEALVPVRPVFRAYDLGVEFNEDYVELMYRLGGRDLGMYLFDSNSVPVRDPGGRLVQPRYRWARSSQPGLTEAEQWWLEVVGGSSCLAIDPTTIPHPAAMVSTGTVLPPDATIEARLVPLVFRDGFEDLPVGASAVGDGAVLGHWWVDDVATEGGPGRWVIEDGGSGTRALVQLGSIGAVPADLGDARRPGTLLRREVAASDYRVTGSVRSTSGGAVGIAARVSGSEAGYLFVMDRGAGYRRLVRMQPGEWAVLAEDQRRYPAGRDHALSLEVLGTWLRAYVGGAPVFQVKDAAYATGGVALHTQSCADAHWRELRVDDLGAGAPVVYKFGFTTSRFTSVYHLAHGGEQRRSTADPPAGLIALVGAAVSPATSPTDDEHRAYDAAAGLVQGPAMHRRPPTLEITRLADAAGLVGFLLASPEPLAWPRLALTLRAGPARPRRDRGPGPARLTEASVGQVDPSAESITVLLDESVDPTTIAVEHLALPGAVDLAGGELIFDERFPGPAGTLHVERFGPGASERFTLLDHGDQDGPSRWRSEDGRMRQLSPIYGGDLGGSDALRPGTMALLGGPSWGDLTIDTVLRTGAPGAIGLVFRHGATGDYYRFAMDRSLDQRRLVRVDAGIATVLWEQAQGFELDRDYRLRVQVLGDTLVGWLGVAAEQELGQHRRHQSRQEGRANQAADQRDRQR